MNTNIPFMNYVSVLKFNSI